MEEREQFRLLGRGDLDLVLVRPPVFNEEEPFHHEHGEQRRRAADDESPERVVSSLHSGRQQPVRGEPEPPGEGDVRGSEEDESTERQEEPPAIGRRRQRQVGGDGGGTDRVGNGHGCARATSGKGGIVALRQRRACWWRVTATGRDIAWSVSFGDKGHELFPPLI